MPLTKKLALVFLLMISVNSLKAQDKNIIVVIENVKDNQGTLWVALYNSESQFMKERFRSLKLSPQNGQVSAVFENIPEGDYAITVLHDANNNKELDTNSLGIPKEGFGFSNNVMGMFGPPSYKKASFVFPKMKEVKIKLRYM